MGAVVEVDGECRVEAIDLGGEETIGCVAGAGECALELEMGGHGSGGLEDKVVVVVVGSVGESYGRCE